MRACAIVASLTAVATLLISCAEGTSVAGSSTSTGNAQATGVIRHPDGHPSVHAFVECRPNSLASWEPLDDAWTVRTDTNGRYRCTGLPEDQIGIHAIDPKSGRSHWHLIHARSGTIDSSGSDTLAAPGRLLVALAPATYGTLHLSGLGRHLPVHGESVIAFPDIPAGWRGVVRLASATNLFAVVDSGHVHSGRTDSAGFTRNATLLSIPLPGGLKTTLKQVPILVRIDSTWNGFATSLPDGSDLRLSLAGGKPLPLTVASWDRAARTGALWTFLDSLSAPGDSLQVVLSSGLPVPSALAASGFSATNGWIAALPLGDTGTDVTERVGLQRSTPTALVPVPGVIGKASRFNGSSSKLVFTNSATGPLALPEGGPYTLSLWARLGSFNSSHLLGNGRLGSHIGFQSNFGGQKNLWLAIDFQASPPGRRFAMTSADSGSWTHLVMTTEGDSVRLFINGVQDAVTKGFDNSDDPKKITLFSLGASLDSLGVPSRFFKGDLAEVWVQSVARSADWIRLTAANQKPGNPAARPRTSP
ncbi:MAG: hypothetical protein RL318_538 [Fibrobacterota bacterium]|jgi:hypothetical protein